MVVLVNARGEQKLKRVKHLLSKGAVVNMTDKLFQYEDNLTKGILEIISHYQLILTMDIWYELGEDDRFEDGIALAEVKEILSLLENSKRIFREDGYKWRRKGDKRGERNDNC